jgi:hypothetical protein
MQKSILETVRQNKAKPKEAKPAPEVPPSPEVPPANKPAPDAPKGPNKKERRRLAKWDDSKSKGGRLPDKAEFHAVYDAATQSWSGSLVIPGLESFDNSASGVFRLLRQLDRSYRQTLGATEQAIQPAGAPEGQDERLART